MKRLANDLVGDVRSVEVAGINVIDAGCDGLPQHGNGGGAILRWTEDTLAGKLHGAVAHAPHGSVTKRKSI